MGQSGPGNNQNKAVTPYFSEFQNWSFPIGWFSVKTKQLLHTSQNSRTWASPLDGLVSYSGHGKKRRFLSFPKVLVQSEQKHLWSDFELNLLIPFSSPPPFLPSLSTLWPRSCLCCLYLQLWPAISTNYFNFIYHGLPGNQPHRLQLHHWFSLSNSNPQHCSDAASAIIHWIHISCMIRLIKACYL